MSIKVLTIVQLNVAIAINKEIVQCFKRDFTKTFFVLKDEYDTAVQDPESTLSALKLFSVFKKFDTAAYEIFKHAQFVRYGTNKSKAPMRMLVVEYIERMYSGIQIVEKHKDVSPDFYSYETSYDTKEKNFCPEHFLMGTQITVSPEISRMDRKQLYPSVFTVQGIRQNGPNSFVLVTTSDDLSEVMPVGEKFIFNISHVENIVLQGRGMIKVESQRQLDYRSIMKYESADTSYPQYAKKNHWLSYGGSMLIMALIRGLNIPKGSVIESNLLNASLLNQSFVKVIKLGGFHPQMYLTNKKRAKRFVKQNLNRFLSSAKKEQQRYDDEMNANYHRSMNDEFDDEFVINNPENKEEENDN